MCGAQRSCTDDWAPLPFARSSNAQAIRQVRESGSEIWGKSSFLASPCTCGATPQEPFVLNAVGEASAAPTHGQPRMLGDGDRRCSASQAPGTQPTATRSGNRLGIGQQAMAGRPTGGHGHL